MFGWCKRPKLGKHLEHSLEKQLQLRKARVNVRLDEATVSREMLLSRF